MVQATDILSGLTAERLRTVLQYDRRTGEFRWRCNLRKGYVGKIAGQVDKDGYRRIGIDGRHYKAHRLAWLYVNGEWPPVQIDHRNGHPDDNRWRNLRLSTQSQNIANAKIGTRNTSGFKGVSLIKASGKWLATIKVDGRSKCLGWFDTPEEAHQRYCRAAKRLFGSYARTE